MMKKIVSFLLAAMLFSSISFAANFTDFGTAHWAYPYVDELVTAGVINGYEDGTYRPEANVTRAELAKLISVQFGESTQKSYTDVTEADWYYNFVTASGDYFLAGGEFHPQNQATREEVAYAIYVAKKLKETTKPATFTDGNQITADYQKAVAAVAESGIITGYPDGSFAPKNNITRAEVATVLCRAINLKEDVKEPVQPVYTEDVYQEVLEAAKLLEGSYNANQNITYGELSAAALRMFNNEWNLAYYNLGDVVNKKPFEHQYALAFWLIGRDVLGSSVVTQSRIDSDATVGDAVKVMAFYAEKHDLYGRTVDTSKLLTGVPASTLLNQKLFAQLLTELDDQIPMLIKVVVTSGNTADKITTAIRKDLASYPSNSEKYPAILEEVPNNVYEAPYALTSADLHGSYDFAREMMSFLLRPLNQFCKLAEAKGATVKIHYYPSLCQSEDSYFTIRAKVEIVSLADGVNNVNQFFNTSLSKTVSQGDSFFCDISTNAKVPSPALSAEGLTVDKIY